MCMYSIDVCTDVVFILQLLFLFGTNMTKFAEDINQFRSDDLKIAHFVDELNKVVSASNKVHIYAEVLWWLID